MYGIIPRAIRDFFEFMNNAIVQEDAQFQIGLNYFEIYMESLTNLLGPDDYSSQNLKIVQDQRVLHAPPVLVRSPEEIFHYIRIGQNRV